MKFGIIHYNAPGDTLEAFLDYAADTGFDTVELFSADIGFELTDNPEKEAERVVGLVKARGLSVSALGAGNDFVFLNEKKIHQQVLRMEQLSKLALILETQSIRTEGGISKPEVPSEKEWEAMTECLKRCCDFIERDHIYLALDNHGLLTNDAKLQIQLFQTVRSDYVGANLDTMNYRWVGHSLETCNQFYDLISPHTFHVHLKDGVGFRDSYQGAALGEGEIDLNHALQALKGCGYDGTLCAEWEGQGDKELGYRKCIEWMQKNVR